MVVELSVGFKRLLTSFYPTNVISLPRLGHYHVGSEAGPASEAEQSEYGWG